MFLFAGVECQVQHDGDQDRLRVGRQSCSYLRCTRLKLNSQFSKFWFWPKYKIVLVLDDRDTHIYGVAVSNWTLNFQNSGSGRNTRLS